MLLDGGSKRGETLVRPDDQVLEIVYERSGLTIKTNGIITNLSPVDVR
jgi:hypothetical protein